MHRHLLITRSERPPKKSCQLKKKICESFIDSSAQKNKRKPVVNTFHVTQFFMKNCWIDYWLISWIHWMPLRRPLKLILRKNYKNVLPQGFVGHCVGRVTLFWPQNPLPLCHLLFFQLFCWASGFSLVTALRTQERVIHAMYSINTT